MLKQTIQDDLSKAVKEKNEIERSVLRMLLASILNKEKEKRYRIVKESSELTEAEINNKSGLTEEEILEAVLSEAKKRKEAIIEYEKGQRNDLAVKEKEELELLKKYLPEQMSEEELKKIAEEAIKKSGAKEMKDMGRIMAEVMPKVKGRADASLVSKIIKELLS